MNTLEAAEHFLALWVAAAAMGGAAVRSAASARILGALAAVSLAATACPGSAAAGTVKARLTVQAKYESTTDENFQENGGTTTGSGKLSITLSITQNVYLEYDGSGGVDTREIPSDEMTAADRPKTSGSLTFVEHSESHDQNGGLLSYDDTFSGPLDPQETSATVGFGGDGMTLLLGAGGEFKGHCKNVVKVSGSPAITSTCGGGVDPPGEDAFRGVDQAGQGAPADQSSVADGDVTFDVRSAAKSDDPGEDGGFLDRHWFGAKTTGNGHSEFRLTLDKTKKYNPSKGVDQARHLMVSANLAPLGPECRLTEAMMRGAMARALAARHLATPPQYLTTAQRDPEFLTYAVRLGAEDDLLPTQDWVRAAVAHGAKPQSGASYLMLGSAQLSDDTYRVTVRVVKTETGEVLAAARHDGKNCISGLVAAATGALASLSAPLKSYRPR